MKPGTILRVKAGQGDRATQSGNGIEDGDIVTLLHDDGHMATFVRANETRGTGWIKRFDAAPYMLGDIVRITKGWSSFKTGAIFTIDRVTVSAHDGQWYVGFVEHRAAFPDHNLGVDMVEAYTPPARTLPSLRSGTQLDKVLKLTLGQGSWTLSSIAAATGASEAAASARLRDIRARGYTVTCSKPAGEKLRRYTVRSEVIVSA